VLLVPDPMCFVKLIDVIQVTVFRFPLNDHQIER